MTEPIDLGPLDIPEAERVLAPWIFRAGCHLKEPEVIESRLVFGLVLDLGFHTYHQISGVLDGVSIVDGMHTLALDFADNWAANGAPNDLSAHTVGRAWGQIWYVKLHRAELHPETLKVIGPSSLAQAMIVQGLADPIEGIFASG